MTDQFDNLNARLTLLQAAVERLATITHNAESTLRMASNDANVAEAKANRALEIVTDLQQRMDGHTQWSASKWEELSKQYRIERAAMDALGVRVGKLERGEVATVATPKPPHQVQAEQELAALRSQLGRMHTMLSDALQADGEQGSAWLSEAFAKRFRIEHPELCAWLENFTKWVTEELED